MYASPEWAINIKFPLTAEKLISRIYAIDFQIAKQKDKLAHRISITEFLLPLILDYKGQYTNEYIEKHIHAKILEEDCSHKSAFDLDKVVAKRITIPETTLMLLCEPWVAQEWNWLKAQTPLISPDYFISIAYKEQEERKNAKAD